MEEWKEYEPNIWNFGEHDLSKPFLNYVWYRNLGLRETYALQKGDKQSLLQLREAIASFCKRYGLTNNMPCKNHLEDWKEIPNCVKNKIVVYISSQRYIDYLLPFMKEMRQGFVVLTPSATIARSIMPSMATIVDFTLTNKHLYNNAVIEHAAPRLFAYANSVAWYMRKLHPKALVCIDGCQTEYELAAIFCHNMGIPSVCIQHGWPSYLHTGFQNMPYTHFLTWGEGFQRLWKSCNPHTKFINTGYMYDVKTQGTHHAITFFLQTPMFLCSKEHLERIYQLIVSTAKRYLDREILVREHPEYKANDSIRLIWSHLPNIRMATEEPLSEVYAHTKVVVSHFSSTLMEGIVHGCTPLVFDPTYQSRYNPDIEAEGLGCIADNEGIFFLQLNKLLTTSFSLTPHHCMEYWFENIGQDAARKMVDEIEYIANNSRES